MFLLGAVMAVVVELPPQESKTDWWPALTDAGLDPGVPSPTGERVVIEQGSGQWTVRVRDAQGTTHSAKVAPPRTPQDRASVAWLAASLLEPMEADPDAIPLPPAPQPKPAKPPPKAAPAVQPPPAPVPEPIPEPEPVVEFVPEPAVVELPPRPEPAPRAGAAVSLGLTESLAPKVGLGLRLERWTVLGFARAWSQPSELGVSHAGLGMEVAWQQALGPVGLGPCASMEARRWRTSARTSWQPLPLVGAQASVQLSAGEGWSIEPRVAVGAELFSTRVVLGDAEEPQPLLRAGLELMIVRMR